MILSEELIIDNFAGGGGASLGIEMALGRSPDVAINHDPEAIAMHKANHPHTEHHCKNIYQIDPDDVIRKYKRRIGFAWFSPDCTHHSKARGGKPRQKNIRDLPWVIVHWAERGVYKGQRPRVIAVENVEEFIDWCPLLEDGQPDISQKGSEFKRWMRAMQRLGYKSDHKILHAHHYGAGTIRKRLVIIFRCDGVPITWPKPTHGIGMQPYRTAAECIDWSIPCPSIFTRKRPLAENTMRRIARGVKKYVLDAKEPFIVNITHTGSDRVEPINEPLRTITSAKRGEKALVCPTLIQVGYDEREGQAPRVPGLDKPLGTVVAGGGKHAIVAAFLAQHNGGYHDKRGGCGRPMTLPVSTITQEGSHQQLVTAYLAQHNGASTGQSAEDALNTIVGKNKHSLVASHLIKLKGSCKDGQSLHEPLHTIQAQGLHYGQVQAFLLKYYGTEQDPKMNEPLHTITARDRFGLVTVHGEDYFIADIGMRMLWAPELYAAQGFHPDYIINPEYKGKVLTKTAMVRMCGNSVSPPMAQAVALKLFYPLLLEQERA